MKTGRRAGAWRFPGSEDLPQEIFNRGLRRGNDSSGRLSSNHLPVMFLVVVPFSLFAAIGSLLEKNTTRQMAAE